MLSLTFSWPQLRSLILPSDRLDHIDSSILPFYAARFCISLLIPSPLTLRILVRSSFLILLLLLLFLLCFLFSFRKVCYLKFENKVSKLLFHDVSDLKCKIVRCIPTAFSLFTLVGKFHARLL